MLEQLAHRVDSTRDSAVRALLARVTSLYALWTMEQNLKWFIATELLIADDVTMIEVCAALPPACAAVGCCVMEM